MDDLGRSINYADMTTGASYSAEVVAFVIRCDYSMKLLVLVPCPVCHVCVVLPHSNRENNPVPREILRALSTCIGKCGNTVILLEKTF